MDGWFSDQNPDSNCPLSFNQNGVYHGNPDVTSVGMTSSFFASVRLEIRPTGILKSVST